MINKLAIATILWAATYTNVSASDSSSITFYDAFQNSGGGFTLRGGQSAAFEFTSLSTGSVSDINLDLISYDNPVTVSLSLYEVTSTIVGSQYDNLRGTQIYTTSPVTFAATGYNETTADFSITELSLNADTNYYIQVNDLTQFNGNNQSPNNLTILQNSALPQIKYVGNPDESISTYPLIYSFEDPNYYGTTAPLKMLITGITPVPAPTTFWLFGTAIAGFIGFNRRNYRNSEML